MARRVLLALLVACSGCFFEFPWDQCEDCIHVSSEFGEDLGTCGAPDKPCQTLEYLLRPESQLNADNNHVFLGAGDYDTVTIDLPFPIQVTGEPGARIIGESSLTILSEVTFEGLTIQGTAMDTTSDTVSIEGTTATFRQVTVGPNPGDGIYAVDSDVTLDGCTITGTDNALYLTRRPAPGTAIPQIRIINSFIVENNYGVTLDEVIGVFAFNTVANNSSSPLSCGGDARMLEIATVGNIFYPMEVRVPTSEICVYSYNAGNFYTADIDANMHLVEPDFVDPDASDYRLQPDSQLRDQVPKDMVTDLAVEWDFEGEVRAASTGFLDIGADEVSP